MSRYGFYKGKHRKVVPKSERMATRVVAVASTIAGTSLVISASNAEAAPDSAWDRLAECESGGNWSINTGNGYSGGLQFSPSTWDAYRPNTFPSEAHRATREQQILVAERVLAGQGWNAWPSCSRTEGLRNLSVNLREVPTRAPATTPPTTTTTPRPAPTTSPSPEPPNVSQELTPSSPSRPQDRQPERQPALSMIPTAPITTDTYTIVEGDMLSSIALRLPPGISWTDIYNANLAVVEDPDLIYPEEVLNIPEPRV